MPIKMLKYKKICQQTKAMVTTMMCLTEDYLSIHFVCTAYIFSESVFGVVFKLQYPCEERQSVHDLYSRSRP